jgi:hypothetical protein
VRAFCGPAGRDDAHEAELCVGGRMKSKNDFCLK